MMALFMVAIFSSCEDGCEETATAPEQDAVYVTISNISYVTLKDVVVYGYKHYCDGEVHHAVVELGGRVVPTGSSVTAYFTFNLSNTRDKIVIKAVATGVDAAGDEFEREKSVTLIYDDFDFGNVPVDIKF